MMNLFSRSSILSIRDKGHVAQYNLGASPLRFRWSLPHNISDLQKRLLCKMGRFSIWQNYHKIIKLAFQICLLTLFMPVLSHASQFSVTGEYDMRFISMDNADDMNDDYHDNQSYMDLRLRLGATVEINENTKGIITLETGHVVFGVDPDDSDETIPGSDSLDLKLKSAYVDFFPAHSESNLLVGLQPIELVDGLLANEDAFGVTYLVKAVREIRINLVKLYDNTVNDEYKNDLNPKRDSVFYSIYYENDAFTDDRFSLLVGYYLDRNALLYDDDPAAVLPVMYSKRDAVFICSGYDWEYYGTDLDFNLLYQRGKRRFTDDLTGLRESKRLLAWLIDVTAKRKAGENLKLSGEFLFATGDENSDDKKDQGFMPIDGLSNYYDRAYIMTGRVFGDDAPEGGLFDSPVRNMSNVIFLKLAAEYSFSNDKRLEIAAMYATHDENVEALSGKSERAIGAEFDATLSFDVFDTYYDTGKGLLFNTFGAYFIPGDSYDLYDGSAADDVTLFGAGLEYTF